MTLLVETCSLHITLCNKNSCADVQISITILIQALRHVFIQILSIHQTDIAALQV